VYYRIIINSTSILLAAVVKITFVEKDAPLALKIKEVIGGGTIVHPKGSNYIDLLFQDLKSMGYGLIIVPKRIRNQKGKGMLLINYYLQIKYS
jgi:hypothetical protein